MNLVLIGRNIDSVSFEVILKSPTADAIQRRRPFASYYTCMWTRICSVTSKCRVFWCDVVDIHHHRRRLFQSAKTLTQLRPAKEEAAQIPGKASNFGPFHHCCSFLRHHYNRTCQWIGHSNVVFFIIWPSISKRNSIKKALIGASQSIKTLAGSGRFVE